jgi:hypothetical protein
MKAIACLALIAAGLASQAQAATTSATSRRVADLECVSDGSDLSAYVIHYGSSPALFVYDGNEELLAAWSSEDFNALGGVLTASYAAGGSIFDGGASLRIRMADASIPATAGSAHLTVLAGGRVQNVLLACHQY